MIGNWNVYECTNCGKRYYTYGDDKPDGCYLGCGVGSFVLLEEGKYFDDDYIAILENELEDANWHSITDLPSKIKDVINKYIYDSEIKTKLIRDICKTIYDMI